tara:strand:- start:5025 stop:5627 length:603 start_codon:yes stop_codon:yes gene_type:complete
MFSDNQVYLVLDTETGGLNPDIHSLLEISGFLWRPFKEIKPLFDTYVKESEIHTIPKALSINKINLSEVRDKGLSPRETVILIKKVLNKELGEDRKPIKIVAHNSSFDYGFLERLYKLAALSIHDDFYSRTIDSASILEFILLTGQAKGYRASADVLFEAGDITLKDEQRHRAYYDAWGTAMALESLINKFKANEVNHGD